MSAEIKVVEELLEKLRDTEYSVRHEAARKLQNISDAAVLPVFLRAIEDDDLSVRMAIVSALSNFEPEQVTELLHQTLFDTEWEVQWASLRALGQLYKESSLRSMGDRLPEKRIAGIQGLVKKQNKQFAIALFASLDDESIDVQIASVRAIIDLHLTEAIEPLQNHLDGAGPELKAWLAEALLRLGGPFPTTSSDEEHPAYLLPCTKCKHNLPPSQLHKVQTWNKEAQFFCQFHFEELIEKIEPFEGKLKRCKSCHTHWPKYEFVDGGCPSCRKQRFENLPPVDNENQFRCFRCQKTFPVRNTSPASQNNKPICSRCAYSMARLCPKQPFLSEQAIHFLSEAFDNGFFLCEQSRHFYPLEEMAEGEDFRDPCVSKEYSKAG